MAGELALPPVIVCAVTMLVGVALWGCAGQHKAPAAEVPRPDVRLLSHQEASFEIAGTRAEAEIDLVILPTGLQGPDGKPAFGSPVDVLVVDPRGAVRAMSESDGSMVNGHFKLSNPQTGRYAVHFSWIEEIVASTNTAFEGEDILFSVKTRNYLDGTPLRYVVCESGVFDCSPSSALSRTAQETPIRSNRAAFHWSYRQPVGRGAGGSYKALVWVNATRGESPQIAVKRFPRDEVRGIKQVLTAFGYGEGGARTDVVDAAMQRALRSFQADNKPCTFGILGPGQMQPCELYACAVGGPERFPDDELGRLGPMTRRAIECLPER